MFKDLYDWCRDFGDEHPECWELCEKRLTHDPEAAAVFKTLIANTLGKATFRAIWRFVASIINYNASFLPDDSGVYPLAHFFIRVILSTMTPMILRLIKQEKALNEANEENEKKKRQYVPYGGYSGIQIAERSALIPRGQQGDFCLDQAHSPITIYNEGGEYFGIVAVGERAATTTATRYHSYPSAIFSKPSSSGLELAGVTIP